MEKNKLFNRQELLNKLTENQEWDIIVIGGGASGLGVALDALSRGFKTLLLEGNDFAKGTSSKSTKLVHGGVRYLAQGNVDLVREALKERGLLEINAPHLVKNQPFIIPNYKWWDGCFYTIGMKIYDLLAGKLSLGKSIHINKNETIRRINTIKQKGLKGGVVYHDGQFDDSRLAINVAQTIITMGGIALNYMKVTELIKENSFVHGVKIIDQETGKEYQLKSKAVVNATGILVDDIIKMDKPNSKPLVRPSQGVHLVLDKSFLPGNDAIMIPKTDDGRVLFIVPWHNRLIVGTTDTPIKEHSLEPIALEEEIEFILKTADAYLEKKPERKDVLSVFAGVRPLAAPQGDEEKTKEISRSHKIIVSDSQLFTLTGGKWTTFRKMGEDTVDKIIEYGILSKKESKSAQQKIYGALKTEDRNNHLYIYGTDKLEIEKLIKQNPELGEKIVDELEFFKAEVVWAVTYEMARTLEDVLARRVRMLYLNARQTEKAAPIVAKIMAKELGYDEQWEKTQVENFIKFSNHYILN